MKFDVYGPFELSRTKDKKHLIEDVRADFAAHISKVKVGNKTLADACGCYVFALQAGRGALPWYVGKTEKMNFSKKCLNATNIRKFEVLLRARARGTPVVYLLPYLTKKGGRFRSGASPKPAVDFLESMLIGMGVQRNKDLENIRKTKMLHILEVVGFKNSRGAPTTAAKKLRAVFGLK